MSPSDIVYGRWDGFSLRVFLSLTIATCALADELSGPPPFLPICAHLEDAADPSPLGRLSASQTQVGVLPHAGSKAHIVLAENGTWPPQATVISGIEPVFCAMRLEACHSCTIGLELEPTSGYFTEFQMDQIAKCDDPTTALMQPCFSLEIIEEHADHSVPLYATGKERGDVYNRVSLWMSPTLRGYNSTANSVSLVVVMRNLERDSQLFRYLLRLFPIVATVYDNTVVIAGRPSESVFMPNQTSLGFIQTPRYPDAYPRMLVKNYTLVNRNNSGFVRLTFDDFHVHYQSELRVLDSDGTELFNTRNEHRRPPALQSSGSRLTVLFHARDFTQAVGFRARYEFVDSILWPERPSAQNCDEYLEGYGGRITLDGYKGLVDRYVDCIWLIGRFSGVTRTFDRIYLKVEEFTLRGRGLRLEVRRGPSSATERVLMLFDQQSFSELAQKQPADGFITDDHPPPAFYVRVRGYLSVNTGLSIIFAQFYRWATALCPGIGEFHCSTANKCIKLSLRCDGSDHCGDGSDEICHLPDGELNTGDVDFSGIITLVAGAVGVLVVLLSVLFFASRVGRQRLMVRLGGSLPLRRTSNERPVGTAQEASYYNELAPTIQTVGERRFYVLPEAQISVIEAPPTYDDAMKNSVPVPDMPPRRSVSSYTNAGFCSSPREDDGSVSLLTTIATSVTENFSTNRAGGATRICVCLKKAPEATKVADSSGEISSAAGHVSQRIPSDVTYSTNGSCAKPLGPELRRVIVYWNHRQCQRR